jgi:16S rRNA (cytidine1402-2'-O)-methyltransferase
MALYLVATPIGNLEDITLRALRILKEVDLIACEDTRHTRRLLDHYGVATPTISYHEHNESSRAAELVERLARGESIAIVTDAGTPGVSDPAYRIVRAAIEHGVSITPIPGPTALAAALTASGLPTDSFLFAGFLSPKKSARRAHLTEHKFQRATLIFYEAPHRLIETLHDLEEILGERQVCVAREITKLHEQLIRGTPAELLTYFGVNPPRGEITLVIAGSRDNNLNQLVNRSITEQVEQLTRDLGISRNEALKEAAASRGLAKRDAYRLLLEEKATMNDE